MDFVFGSLSNDKLKLTNHRAERRGVQHQHHITPLDPSPGEAVTVSIVISGEIQADAAALYYTTDGSEPAGSRGTATNGTAVQFVRVKTEWDTLIWGYLTHWQAIIPAQEDGILVRYVISTWSDEREVYADWPDAEETLQHAAMAYFNDKKEDPNFTPGDPNVGQIFTYYVDTIRPPDWAKDAIIYHIFINSFYPGDGKDWLQTDDLLDFCGGTLWGVRDKLDYLNDLGIDCIWLSPTWASPTNHGYDVTDYKRTETRIGGNEALRAVIEGAHQRSIRVLLDMACNHISNQHPIFVDALNNTDSPYRNWFTFDDSELGYKSFFGVKTMPQVNLAFPDARDWMIDNALYWLQEFDIDGYRLDYAHGPGPDFWTYFRKACKTVKPDCLLFGEIIDAPNKLQHYKGRLDGSLDFSMNDALRKTFAWKVWDDGQLQRFITSQQTFFGSDFVMPTFLDNHDMDRFSFVTNNNNEALKQAAGAQFQLPGPPIIYYGTEVGVKQEISTREGGLHLTRVPMLWDSEQDEDLLGFYKDLIRRRKT